MIFLNFVYINIIVGNIPFGRFFGGGRNVGIKDLDLLAIIYSR